ncbi:TOMM precursor leader peptide-binding protein [Cryobacterium sp. SO2]|uniref:TOMM precursor leader peptide-binding protein n=1 Tax=Cryobacterium sp. SO2 TaxID=1897060 RepID=UPI00223DE1F7|nr:TOMM precursor leader peptide-binding protein [Cryobacterium sp. SO2]WEO78544.1 TOMM precursor leader peptide-binding protein [Cryobacterium sp. SO2]
MILRLDPRYPLVWRTPDTIQLGIDRPLAIVPGVTAPLESVIAALRVGVPRSGALMLGRQAGATDAATIALLRALAPALVTVDRRQVRRGEPAAVTSSWFSPPTGPDASGPRPVVCVDGAGHTADRIRGLLTDLGVGVVSAGAQEQAPGRMAPDLAVIVDHFVLAPERHGRWLRRDVPHLPVLFSDAEARVGPLVEPGAGPCLTCLELERVDDDPAWPAIASQLLHRTAPTETTRLGIEVATAVAGIVHERLFAASNEFAAASLAIDAETLMVRRRAHRPHERCGCRFLPENVIVLAGNAAGFRPRTS